jgi:hypothetical protein
MHFTATRYEIELDVIERRPELRNAEAIELLRSEYRTAINASHFTALSAEDPTLVVRSRSFPQEGVARYALTLEFAPRRAMREDEAVALVHSEFVRANNASYFWRVFAEDPAIKIAPAELAYEQPQRRAA